MAADPAAASDHPAPSQEVERKPRSEAKYMEAETVAPVKHEEPACPALTSTESEAERVEKKVEPLPVNERVEGDIKPKAEGSVHVATSLAEPIEIKTEDVDNKALELEHKPVELSISEPSTLKDVTEAEFKVEEKPCEKSGVTEDPTIRVEEKGVECYPTEEVKEKTGEEKEPPAKEIIEVKEKVSDPGRIEATSEEKHAATEEFVQFEENPTNDANTAEDEVTDNETLQATEEKMEATVGDIKTEFEGEKQVTQSSEPIVENAKTEVGHKKASEETAEDKFKETVLSTEEKSQETVATISGELEEEKQADETVSDAKISEPLPELIAENAKIKAYNKESSDELQKNVAAESINETVKATDDKIEEAVGASKAELEGEKQVEEPVHDAKRWLEPITENFKTEADNKEASEERDKNVAAEKIKESVQATEEKIEESVRTIKAEVEGDKQVEDPVNDAKCSNPLPKLIAENAKTEADDKESSDETEKNVVAESIKEIDEKIEETVGTIEGEVEGEKKVEEPINDAKSSDSLHELISENAKTEKDNKESSDEPVKNVAPESIKETFGAIKAEFEGEKQVDEPVPDAKTSDPLPERIAENAKPEADNKEASEETNKNVAAEKIKESVQATEEKIEESVRTIKAEVEVEGEKQVEEPVNEAKRSGPCPELIAENAKTEADSRESSDELEKNVAAESIKETDEKIEETVGAIKAELDGEKQVDELVHDAKTSDPLPELIAENTKTEVDSKESSDEPEKNVAAESIKETDEKIEEAVGTIKAELEGEKQVDEPVNDAKCSDSLPEPVAENAKTEADNKESSDESEKNVAAESIKETAEKIEETVGAIKTELEGEKRVDEPVNDAKTSDPLPEPIAENSKTGAVYKEANEEIDKNVAAEKIKESVQTTEEKIEQSVRTIQAEVEGVKQVEEPVTDAKCSNPLPELIEENAKTEADNKESCDETEKNVVAESIKETDEKVEETVGTIEAEVEGGKQVEEPVNDAKSSDSLHELISENAKTEKDNKESSDEMEKNLVAESIKETDEKVEETVGTIEAEVEGGKQVEEPVNYAKSSDSLHELISENAKTEKDNKESSDEPEKNVAPESIKETDEKIEETVEAIKAELDGEKQVDEPVNDAKISDPLPELVAENAKTEADNKESSDEHGKNVAAESIKESVQATDDKIEETVGTIEAEVEGEKQVEEPVNDAKCSYSLPQLIAGNVKTEVDNKESSDEPEKNVAAESLKETLQPTEEKVEETVGAIEAELEGEKQVEEPVYDAKSSDSLPELSLQNDKTAADNKEASEENDKNVAAEIIKESVQTTEKIIEETAKAIKPELEVDKQVDELVKNTECIKEIEDTKKPQDVPVKTHKQSIVKMVKQSLVKAKKAITGKSHNSKTQASEPKDEGN